MVVEREAEFANILFHRHIYALAVIMWMTYKLITAEIKLLLHMKVDYISTGHHAKIVSAGNDSELAKNA